MKFNRTSTHKYMKKLELHQLDKMNKKEIINRAKKSFLINCSLANQSFTLTIDDLLKFQPSEINSMALRVYQIVNYALKSGKKSLGEL